jgi:hypothetical protein
MATNSKTVGHADNVLNLIRGSSITAPATISLALHRASTLAANAASGATSVSMNHAPIVGTDIIIDRGGAVEETRTVTSVSGTGPYTVSFSGGLSNAHNAGAYVQIDPGEDLSRLIEPTGGGYARKSVAANTTEWSAPSDNAGGGRKIQNNNAQSFGQASIDQGLITHGIVYNGANGWYYGALQTPKRWNVNDTFEIPALGLTIIED